MTEKKSWYSTGYEGIDREKDRIARLSGPNRFWIKVGTSREIIFIDDEPLCIYEHNPKLNGRWQNWFTCLRDSHDQVVCCEKLGDKTRYYVGYYTIVDLTENVDAKGNKYQYEVKLLPTKLKSLSLMRRKKQDRGSLIGCAFKVHRDSEKDPNCGGEYEFQREGNLEKLFTVANYKGKKLVDLYKEASEQPAVMQRLKDTFQLQFDDNGAILPKIFPFNYFNLLQPKDPKDLRAILGAASLDTGSEASDSPQDDDIPF